MKNEQIKTFINKTFNNPKHLSHARIQYLLKIDFILKQCEEDLKNNTEWENKKNILLGYFYDIPELIKCDICKKNLKIKNVLNIYKNNSINEPHYCSRKCQGEFYKQNKTLIQNKIKQTNLEKYGVENPFQSDIIKDKIKQTNLKKYGVENPFQSDIIKDKIKQTNLERYGVEHTGNLEEIKEKVKQTNLQKYGTIAPLQNPKILNKLKQTNLERYGVECCLLNEDIKQKSKQTCLKKYDVEHSALNENRIKILLDKSWNTILSWEDVVIPLFSRDEWVGANNKIYKWKCSKCGQIFESNIHHNSYIFNNNLNIKNHIGFENIPRCFNCYPESFSCSYLEKDVLNFCKQYFTNILENDKKLINPYELDIVIPEKKIAIEFNGDYWHSESNGKDKSYHLLKTKLCEQIGFKLIHIFEYEWIYKNNIVKQRLLNLFDLNKNNFYARKCIVKNISSKDKGTFLNTYHLQGNDKSKIKLGLFYNEELIAVMTFGKPRFNKNYEWELIRYASNGRVIGGASKLLKYFERNYNPKSLITYADRCWSQGNLYQKLNFIKINETEPSYLWVKSNQIYTRYQTQKYKLKSILGDKYNSNLTEMVNMSKAGFNKIFDCGNYVYAKNY